MYKYTTKTNLLGVYPCLQHRDRNGGRSRCVWLLLFCSTGQLMLKYLLQSVELTVAGEAHVHRRSLHGCQGTRKKYHLIQ